MPYAEGRTYCDADSHVMEIDDWRLEGGKDLLARFEATLAGVSDAAEHRFCSGNVVDLVSR